jgi:hypothetical protein
LSDIETSLSLHRIRAGKKANRTQHKCAARSDANFKVVPDISFFAQPVRKPEKTRSTHLSFEIIVFALQVFFCFKLAPRLPNPWTRTLVFINRRVFVGWLDFRKLAKLEERYQVLTELRNASIDFCRRQLNQITASQSVHRSESRQYFLDSDFRQTYFLIFTLYGHRIRS